MAPESNRIIFGAAKFGNEGEDDTKCQGILDVLKSKDVLHLDTAQLYGMGKSESTIGRIKALEQGFTIDTKWLGGWLGKTWATHDTMVSSAKDSLQKLGVHKENGHVVDIFYIHSPDASVQFADTLKGVNDAYREGGFKRFGLR